MNEFTDNNLLTHSTPYNIIRSDRLNGCGGGTCLFISNTIPFNEIEISQTSSEISCVDLLTPNDKIRLILLYRSNSKETIKDFKRTLNQLYDISTISFLVILLGDFNMSGIDWKH